MNWRRGTTRLWVALAILWVGYATWTMPEPPLDGADKVEFQWQRQVFEFPNWVKADIARRAISRWAAEHPDQAGKDPATGQYYDPSFVGRVAVGSYEPVSGVVRWMAWTRRAANRLMAWSERALLPPLASIIIIVAGIWVVRGYRVDGTSKQDATP